MLSLIAITVNKSYILLYYTYYWLIMFGISLTKCYLLKKLSKNPDLNTRNAIPAYLFYGTQIMCSRCVNAFFNIVHFSNFKNYKLEYRNITHTMLKKIIIIVKLIFSFRSVFSISLHRCNLLRYSFFRKKYLNSFKIKKVDMLV